MAILGRQDSPTDAVEEYCQYLSTGLAAHGVALELKQVGWAEKGWRAALRELRASALANKNTAWFLLQYTALSWSRRGFAIRAVQVIRLLKKSGARCAVVFHDVEAFGGHRLVDRFRRSIQHWSMRQTMRLADLAIFVIPTERIPWMRHVSHSAKFIPVGANLPSPEMAWEKNNARGQRRPTVAIFSLSDGSVRDKEVSDIAEAVRYVSERVGSLRVVALGRNSGVGAEELKRKLAATPVEIVAHGLLAAEQVVSILANCDVMLFARGFLSTRRGSALAGIACGLPIVGREGWETAAPITEAGVILVGEREKEGFGPALFRVLSNESYRASLAKRSQNAQKQYFSWEVIAAEYARALRE